MKISTVIGGGLLFIAGIGAGMYLTCKAVTKIDNDICDGKLSEDLKESAAKTITSFVEEKAELKRPARREFELIDDEFVYGCLKNIVFESKDRAEEILNYLNAIINRYGSANVADLYDKLDTQHQYKDTKYGWIDELSSELIVSKREGTCWSIDFPDVQYLD